MEREVKVNGSIIKYELIRKKVKNLNLRITPDLKVKVSAGNRVSLRYIDDFVAAKAGFIQDALDLYRKRQANTPKPLFEQNDFLSFVHKSFEEVYGLFIQFGIKKPALKLRQMKSRWGSCNYVKGIISLSTNLIYCTEEQIHYVIVHEFSHLLVHNHSKDFYDIVVRFSPDYKRIRKEMRNINI